MVSHNFLLRHAVNLDACIGTNKRTTLATDTSLRLLHVSEMISAVIHLFLFEVQHIAGTSHNTQAASLASFRIYYYGSMNFCHKKK